MQQNYSELNGKKAEMRTSLNTGGVSTAFVPIPGTGGWSRLRFIKKILERGTVTVPSDVREAMGVEEGDIVEFQILRIVKRGDENPVAPSKTPALAGPDAPPSTPARDA